jgi:CheY-like chemotaxis protein
LGLVQNVLVGGLVPRTLEEMLFTAISKERACRYCEAAHLACCRMLAFGPDIAVLDIGLPVIDGYDFAREIRGRLGPATPFLIALTVLDNGSERRLARKSSPSALGAFAHTHALARSATGSRKEANDF